ncbi:MAG: hypothetical protein MK106_12535 [Mariniblastus sp.]|nr:hypothetical protein [Mariniblastus sp.]
MPRNPNYNTRKPIQQQVTNWRLLLTTTISVAVIAPLLYLWHGYCVSKMGRYFLDRALIATELATQKEEIEKILLGIGPLNAGEELNVDHAQKLKEFDEQLQLFDSKLASKNNRPSSTELWGKATIFLDLLKNIEEVDGEVRRRLAVAYSKSTLGIRNPRRCAQLYAQAALLSPERRDELLIQAADFYNQAFDFDNAEQALEQVTRTDNLSDDSVAVMARVKANSLWGNMLAAGPTRSNDELGPFLSQAIVKNPEDIDLPVFLALLYATPNRRGNLGPNQVARVEEQGGNYQAMANQIVDAMVNRNPSSAMALLQRYKFRTNTDAYNSIKDLLEAEKLEPTNVNVQFELGKARYDQYQQALVGQPTNVTERITEQPRELINAKANFKYCAQYSPRRMATFLYLGEIERQLGNVDDAIEVWLAALDRLNSFTPDLTTLVRIRQNTILALIEQHDANDHSTANRLTQAKEQLARLGEFITQSANASLDPELLFELSQTRQYLEAILLTETKQYGSAIDLLVPAIRNESSNPNSRTVLMARLLGTIYSELGLNEQAAKIYNDAAEMTDEPALRKEFSQRASQKRAKSGNRALTIQDVPPPNPDSSSVEEWYQYAQFILQNESRKPKNQRDLTAFTNAMSRVSSLRSSETVKDTWRFDVAKLIGETLVLESSKAELSELVKRVRALEPEANNNVGLTRGLADLYRRLNAQDPNLGLSEDTTRMIDQYIALSDRSAESFIVAANILIGQKKSDEAKSKIQEGLDTAKPNDQKNLRLAMVSLLLTEGNVTEAYESLLKLADDFPDSPDLTTRLASFCVQFPMLNTDEPAAWETRLKRIEGAEGVYSKCLNVIRTLRSVETSGESADLKLNQEQLNAAKTLCRSIVSQRPDWSIGHTLTGQVLLAQSNNIRQINLRDRVIDDSNFVQLRKAAVNAFSRGVELGESRRWVLVPLAQMQTPQERKATLALLNPGTIVQDPDLLRMQVSMSIAGNDTENALRTVEFATKANPKNGLNWLTLAAIQLNLGRSDDAFASCQTARELTDNQPLEERQRTMKNLLNFYSTASQFGPQPANTTWEKQAVTLQPLVVTLFEGTEKTFQEARTLSQIGNPRAAIAFSKVVDEAPKNPTYLRAALAYFTSGKTSAETSYAEGIRVCQLLRELPNLDDRQRLTFVWTQANLYAKRGTNDDWASLKALFSENNIDPSARNASEYNILLAVLLLTKEAVTNSERQQNLNEAFQLVEKGSNTAELVLGGQVQELLAPFQKDKTTQLELIADARSRFIKAGEATDLATAQVSTIIKFFINQQDLDNADLYLTRLKSMVGTPLVESIPAVGLQSEIMNQRGVDPAEITRIIDEFGTDMASEIRNTSKMNQAKQYQRIASIFDSVNLPNQSLKWNEKAVAIEPRFRLALAMENNKLGNKDKAVDLCLEAFSDTGDTSYLIALTQILITGKASPYHFQKANPIFSKALVNKTFNRGQRINLLLSIANVRIAGEGRTRDAIELYEQAAKLAPGNLLILNNLATAYSEPEGELNIAMEYINQALLRHGNRPELIDTKAVILMKLGKLQSALELLTDITNLESDPRYWWHRAEVEFKIYQKSANADLLKAARKHFQTAQNLQLANQIFTPNEELRLDDLEKELSAAERPSVNSSSRCFSPNASSAMQISAQTPQPGMQVLQ